MLRTLLVWIFAGALYGAFWLWYHGSGEPLAEDEIEMYLERLEERGRDPERLQEARAFMESDDGGEFYMVNLINMREQPLQVGDVEPGETANRALARYTTQHMAMALLKRAGYFVVAGSAAGGNIEQWGLTHDPYWTRAGVVRYRSRRDLMEIATDPAFIDAVQYKFAAIEQTFAFPIAPAMAFVTPKHVTLALTIALGLLLQLVTRPRRTAISATEG
ncbi:MAG TPA: hypothetical protein VF210_06105 [Pseudomonadales bacterium]